LLDFLPRLSQLSLQLSLLTALPFNLLCGFIEGALCAALRLACQVFLLLGALVFTTQRELLLPCLLQIGLGGFQCCLRL
jgi:hypothetical protein